MAYIRSDGTVVQGMRPPPKAATLQQKAQDTLGNWPWHWRAVAVAVVALACRQFLTPDPFKGGKIPASDYQPNEHFDRIRKDDMFMRTMTAPLGKKTYWAGRKKRMEHHGDNKKGGGTVQHLDIMLGKYDFGGPDGHVAESGDWADIKYVQGTRCSTTQSAVTAYFCGAEVAENQDVGLEHRKGSNFGVESFANFLMCRHKEGERTGSHKRSVYRLGIGCKDPLAGYSHAFSIVAQPDGTFYWLQSFISQYSLPQWMNKPDAHLSLPELQAKLKQVKRLMNIAAWTDEANQDYLELFGVDKNRSRKRHRQAVDWKPTHRLDMFYWDEACEYPLPSSDEQHQGATEQQQSATQKKKTNGFDIHDDCMMQNIMEQLKGAARSGMDLTVTSSSSSSSSSNSDDDGDDIVSMGSLLQ